MPEFSADAPRETYTIAKHQFTVPQVFTEGHPLTSGQASALNQVLAENVRNNHARKIVELEKAGTFSAEDYQSVIDKYVTDYEFGQRSGGGGRVTDPVEKLARQIAEQRLAAAMAAKGIKLSDYTAEARKQAVDKVLEKYPDIRETAKSQLSTLDDLDLPAPELDSGDEAPKGRKAKGGASEAPEASA